MNLTRQAEAGTPGRRAVITASVLAAVLLNSLALGVFAAVVGQWHGDVPASIETSWITTRAVAAAAPAHSVAPPPPHARALAPAPAVPPPPPQAEPSPADQQRTDAAEAGPASAALPTDDPTAVRFFRFGEVDQPAEPDSDWNLDTALLDTLGLTRLVFEVFIGSGGEIVECRIVEPQTLPLPIRQALEDRLRQTTVQPARRGGVAVASVRKIELSLLPSE